MTDVLLDTHVLYWWTVESPKLSARAVETLEAAETLNISGITWYELAWLAARGKIEPGLPLREWLSQIAADVTTAAITPAIAATAATLAGTFPGDPADRIIYATAIERGFPLLTKDGRIRKHDRGRKITIW